MTSPSTGVEELRLPENANDVWGWADRFSKHIHRLVEIKELRRDIQSVGRRCGDCRSWMKSRECPRENNVNGISRGPSGDDLICGKFTETPGASQRRVELSERLTALLSQSPGMDKESVR